MPTTYQPLQQDLIKAVTFRACVRVRLDVYNKTGVIEKRKLEGHDAKLIPEFIIFFFYVFLFIFLCLTLFFH
jgi:hypothetical protein